MNRATARRTAREKGRGDWGEGMTTNPFNPSFFAPFFARCSLRRCPILLTGGIEIPCLYKISAKKGERNYEKNLKNSTRPLSTQPGSCAQNSQKWSPSVYLRGPRETAESLFGRTGKDRPQFSFVCSELLSEERERNKQGALEIYFIV